MWLEILKDLKMKSGMTAQELAEKSNVPLSTVKRILSGQTDNPGIQTVCDLFAALGSPLGESPAAAQNTLQKPAEIHDDAKDEIIRILRLVIAHKNKWMRGFVITIIVLLFLLFAILLYDVLNPNIGIVRY